MRILYIPNDCSTTGNLPFLVWGGVQATTGEVWPRNGPSVCKTLAFDFCGFCLRILGMARIVRPHLLADTVSKQKKFDYTFLYLLGLEGQFSAMEDVVHLDTFWISAAQ